MNNRTCEIIDFISGGKSINYTIVYDDVLRAIFTEKNI